MTEKYILDTLQHIENEINFTLEELSSIKQEMEEHDTEESARVFKFILNLQRSGFSQQINAEEAIQKHFGFSKEKSEKFLFMYIEGISEIYDKLGGSMPVSTSSYSPLLSDISESSSHVSDSQIKKKKGPKPYSEMTPEELAIAKAKRLEKSVQPSSSPEVAALESVSKPVKRVVKVKKMSDGIKIWNSFLKIIKAEMEASGVIATYEELVKKAKEMKEADTSAYELFSATWTPEDDSSLSNS